MGPLVIVESEVGAQLPSGLDGVGVSFQVHLDTCNLEHSTSRQNIYLGGINPRPRNLDHPWENHDPEGCPKHNRTD